MSSPAIKESSRTGKWWRFRLADMQNFGEVEVQGWWGRPFESFAYLANATSVHANELFPSEAEALQVAIRALRDDEERIYRQRQQLMKRLDEIE